MVESAAEGLLFAAAGSAVIAAGIVYVGYLGNQLYEVNLERMQWEASSAAITAQIGMIQQQAAMRAANAAMVAFAAMAVLPRTLEEIEEDIARIEGQIAIQQTKLGSIINSSKGQKGGAGPYRTTGTEQYIEELEEQLRRALDEVREKVHDDLGEPPPEGDGSGAD